jgi:hypothetical protein
LTPKLLLRPVEGCPVIGAVGAGYEDVARSQVKPQFDSLLDPFSIEYHDYLHRT